VSPLDVASALGDRAAGIRRSLRKHYANGSPGPSTTGSGFVCPVTFGNEAAPPGEVPTPDKHGNGRLFTILWPYGTVIADPVYVEPDGSIGMKWPWVRGPGVAGALTVEGKRLNGEAPPLRAEIPEGYGETGFQPTGLFFGTEGCWQITGRVGQDSLTVVTLVIKAPLPIPTQP
jgi:hypothetical protein